MSDLEYRSVGFESFEVRESDSGWTIEGLAVPYGSTATIQGKKESFERGVFRDYDGQALLFSQHDHQAGGLPIGSITETEDREDGFWIKAKISATAKGTEVRQLVRDGVLKSLSVGFEPLENREEDGVLVQTRARLREVSVVPLPAYADAAISAIRSASNDSSTASAVDVNRKDQQMTDTTNAADLTEVRSEVEDLSRRFTVLETRGEGTPAPAVRFNSLGEFIKGLAPAPGHSRSVTKEDAEMLTRAYTGATVSDNGAQAPTWIQRDIKLIQQNRNVLELFSKEALPSEGMSISYPIFGSTVGDVAVQATEGADLTYLELVTGNASAPVVTYGGYSSLSRQLIERTSVAYLNKVLEFQKLSYAKVTNGAVRTLLGTTPTAYNQVTMPALAQQGSAKAWVDAVLASTQAIGANSIGLTADVWVVSFAVFQKLASVYDSTGRPVFVINGDGTNTAGNVDVRGLKANVAGLPVVVDAGLSGTDTFVVSRDAITVMESGPFNLNDENIINLTKDFSIYGYLAMTKNDVKGISRVIVPAA